MDWRASPPEVEVTEAEAELKALQRHANGLDIGPDGSAPERASYG
jgi:phage host-nuclease inhibitor protein Gam